MKVINVKQAPELCLTDAFTSSGSRAALLAQANTQTRVFRWKWTTLVRLEVSGDNAGEQCLPFSINTISMQEMSLRVLYIMSAVLCSNKRISRDVLNTYSPDAWSAYHSCFFSVLSW